MNVCLVGNPNSGKSTLFNALTGLNQRVGNYPGITVDVHKGSFYVADTEVRLIDLPGLNSIYPKTEDERLAWSILLNEKDPNYPDLCLLVVDATQLNRSLVLATQVIDLQIPCIVVINMIDEVKGHQKSTNYDKLEEELNTPVLGISAKTGLGIRGLKKRTIAYNDTKPALKPFFLSKNVKEKPSTENGQKSHYATRIEQLLKDNLPNTSKAMAQDITARYQKINHILRQCILTRDKKSAQEERTQKIDKVLTNKYVGLPIAFIVLLIIFQAIFSFAEYPMNWIEEGFQWLSNLVAATLPKGWLNDLLAQGLLAGLSGVLVFVPQIAILFALLAVLEGTGYMARLSYMFDKLMTSFGLSGKAVVPMMSSFACAVPAIMATRSIQSWKERIITIMVMPLLSCSARLPVYVLLIGLFIPSKKVFAFFNLQGLTMMGFYVIGLVFALIIAAIFHKLLKLKEESHFILELPRYRWPQWRNVLITAYQKVKVFVIEAGRIILIISVVLWALASYGPKKKMQTVELKYEQLKNERGSLSNELKQQYASEMLTTSYAGHLGKFIEPVIKPLGYDWKIGIALLTSFAAREVFVGTMATIYSIDADEEDPTTLRQRLLAEKDPQTGLPVYSLATVFSLLVFYAFAMQCLSTLAIVKRETKSWKWPILQLVYLTTLAYGCSFLTYFVLQHWT